MLRTFSGNTIKGYTFYEAIGAGAFATVFRAFQPVVEREVAIKIIYPEFSNHIDFIRLFESEAQLIAQLEHPYIVPLYDYWRDTDGAFLVMRFLRGGTLHQALSERWSISEIVRLMDQIASALATAHHNSVIHRDIKPENILLDEHHNAFLSDFGIAKGHRSDESMQMLLKGSPKYAAPEQYLQGKNSPQSDIYSLGVILYELLTGHHPFNAAQSDTELIEHHQNKRWLPITEWDNSRQLNNVLEIATAKDPNARFADVVEFANAFRAACADMLPNQGVADYLTATDMFPLENPYKGLRAFDESDALDFFGREDAIQELVSLLGDQPDAPSFLAVVGSSGSGKSSLVRAGLIPALRSGALPNSDQWLIATMLPGANPIEALGTCLQRIAVFPDDNLQAQLEADDDGLYRVFKTILPEHAVLFLFIDQFEEIYTQSANVGHQNLFLHNLESALTRLPQRLHIVIALRADFYNQCLQNQRFARLLQNRAKTILPLSPEELEQAIERPANRFGIMVERALVVTIVAEMTDAPGMLPLLQYALTELFDDLKTEKLRLQDYQALGGGLGLLSKRAEMLYQSLTPSGQVTAHKLFLNLVTIGDNTEATRRRIPLHELPVTESTSNRLMQAIIEKFSKHRLLIRDQSLVTHTPTIEIAHEALIQHWQRLHDWVHEARTDIQLHHQLNRATNEWLRANQDPSYLLRGKRLTQFELWASSTSIDVGQQEQEFLNRSLEIRRNEQALIEKQAAYQKQLENRAQMRMRIIVLTLISGLIISMGLILAVMDQARVARSERDNAEVAQATSDANADEARSIALAAQSISNGYFDLALAVQANRIPNPPVEAQRILYQMAYNPGAAYALPPFDGAVLDAIYLENANYIAVAHVGQDVAIWNLEDRSIMMHLPGNGAQVTSLAIASDGAILLGGTADGTILWWSLETSELMMTRRWHTGSIHALALSPDGDSIASAAEDGMVMIADVQTAEIMHRLQHADGDVWSVYFSPMGRYVATGGADRAVLWDSNSGEMLRQFDAHTSVVHSVMISPDGRHLRSASCGQFQDFDGLCLEGEIQLWDITTGRLLQTLRGHTADIWDMLYTDDGTHFVTASADGHMILWNSATGEQIFQFVGHQDWVRQIDYDAVREALISASYDGRVLVWDITADSPQIAQIDHEWGLKVVYHPNGESIFTSSWEDAFISAWDVASGALLRRFEGLGREITQLAISDDGQMLVGGDGAGNLFLWDVEAGFRQLLHPGTGIPILSLDFHPFRSQVAVGFGDGRLSLWDVEDGEQLFTIDAHVRATRAVAFSENGQLLASGGADNNVLLVEAATGTILVHFTGHQNIVNAVAFSPNTRYLISGSADNTIIIWDIEAQRQIQTLFGHANDVQALVFTADGRHIVSGAGDGRLMLWEVATGAIIYRFNGHSLSVTGIAVSPDEHTAVSVSQDNTIRFWRLSKQSVIDWVEANRYIANLGTATSVGELQQPYDPITIDVWFHNPSGFQREALIDVFEDFNAQHDDIRVRTIELPQGEYNEQVQAAANGASIAGDLPCLLDFDGPNTYNYVWNGFLVPLDQYISDEMRADFLPSILAQGTYQDGQLYSLGSFDSGLAIWGNRQYLEAVEARLPTVDNPWTKDEFNALLHALQALPEVEYALDMSLSYQVNEWLTYGFSPIVQSFGGDLVNRNSYQTAQGVLNGEAAVAALTLVQSWVADGYLNANPDDTTGFVDGRIALSWIGHWEATEYVEALGDDLLLLPMPDFGGGAKTGMGSWNWAITSTCENPDAAWRVLDFVLSPENIELLTALNKAIPARRSVIENSTLYRPGELMALYFDQIEAGYAVPRPITPAYPTITRSFAEAVIRIVEGGDVQTELNIAVAQIDQELAAYIE